MINNIAVEESRLKKDIWRFIIEENKSNYTSYFDESEKEKKTLAGMKSSKRKLGIRMDKLQREVIVLQNKLTSVLPSINEINKILKSFGFTNFELAESNEKGNYKVIRGDGVDVNETLSEGEMTFITFLYFHQLIKGSNQQDKLNTKRVIVIDDPVSSLDSNVLFIVSHLINNLKQEIRKEDSLFKQLIILTHNVYFHKEISFNRDKRNQKQSDETYWILTKINDVSRIREYEDNPIKNSYELLWKELKENQKSITIPNIMRRILENYFKFFGNINIYNIVEEFPSEDKVLCSSLLSWVNDGSHHVNDDLYVDSSEESNRAYFNVFRKIFVNSGHESHFNMMLGDHKWKIEDNEMGDLIRSEVQAGSDQVAANRE